MSANGTNGHTGHGPIETRLFIDGEFVESSDKKTFKVVNPATKTVVAEVFEATADDTNRAVAAAKKAFPAWSALSAGERGSFLEKFGSLMLANANELAKLESISMGTPENMVFPVYAGAEKAKLFAGLTWQAQGKTSLNNPGLFSFTLRQPYGVVAAIIPWNVPMLFFCWKACAALAAGNTVVLKSSEKAPLTSLKLAHLIKEAGFPPGVINVLSGHGVPCGQTLAEHMDVRAISFTGSGRTGRLIQAAAAKSNLKTVTLELGGKSPAIVFEDADLDSAVQDLAGSMTFLSGQMCMASSRVYVQDTIAPKLIQKYKEMFGNMVPGDPSVEGTIRGPQVDEIQYNNVKKYIESGRNSGAKMVLGDGPPASDKGYYINSTIFTDTPEDAAIMKEEIFGPVVNINTFKTEEEAVAKSNATEYGLYASVYTKDLDRAIRVAKAFESGNVSINCTSPQYAADLPFGGYKGSGVGREGLMDSLEHFLEVKTVIIKTG